MKKMIIFGWMVGVLFGLSAQGEVRLPQPKMETLPNGLQIVWFPDDKVPVVDLLLLVKSGERDDPPGKSGTSSLLASVLSRGAGGVSATDLAHSVERLGASLGISSDDDSTTIALHGLAPDASELLRILSLLATKPDFPESEVTREHERILDRWRHLGDSAEILASIFFQKKMMAGTQFGRVGFGSVQEFSKVTRDDVLNYYKTHFSPRNSMLVVVGQVDPAVFREKLVTFLGEWKGSTPNRQWRNYTDRRVVTRPGEILLVDRPGQSQAQIRVGLPAPSVFSPDRHALLVGNALFGEYFNSRLVSVIRDQLGLTYGIGSGFMFQREFGRFSISASTRTEAVGELLAETLKQLDRWQKESISQSEVQTAREYLMGSFPLSVASVGAVASKWLSAYHLGLGTDVLSQYSSKIQNVTTEQVNQAVRKNIDSKKRMIVIAGDAKMMRKSLEKKGYKKFKILTASDWKE